MRLYYNIWIRPTDYSLPSISVWDKILDIFDRLEKPISKSKFSVEAMLEPCGDGTDLVEVEAIKLDSGTMQVTDTEYQYLRAVFHNQLIDVLLFDTDVFDFAVVAIALRCAVTLMVTSGETKVIKLTAERTYASSNILIPWELYDLTLNGGCGLLTGTVYDHTKMPKDNALIQVIVPEFGTFSAVSDKDGRYEVLLPVQGKNMEAVCTANGDRFETVTLPPITGNAETVLDIYAEVPEA